MAKSDSPCRYTWTDDHGKFHECMNWGGHRSLHRCCCQEWADE